MMLKNSLVTVFPVSKFLSFSEIPYSNIRSQLIRINSVPRELITSGKPNSALGGNILLTYSTRKLDFTDAVLSEGNQTQNK